MFVLAPDQIHEATKHSGEAAHSSCVNACGSDHTSTARKRTNDYVIKVSVFDTHERWHNFKTLLNCERPRGSKQQTEHSKNQMVICRDCGTGS